VLALGIGFKVLSPTPGPAPEATAPVEIAQLAGKVKSLYSAAA